MMTQSKFEELFYTNLLLQGPGSGHCKSLAIHGFIHKKWPILGSITTFLVPKPILFSLSVEIANQALHQTPGSNAALATYGGGAGELVVRPL